MVRWLPFTRGACALACAVALDARAGDPPPGPGAAEAEPGPAPAPASSPAGSPAAPAPARPAFGEELQLTPRRTAADDPAAVTVVSVDTYAGEAKTVAELVSTAPGVAVNDYGGLGQLATASIRGSTADGVLVLLDGLPLNSAFGGGVDLSSIPRHWISRVEVIRGVEGARFGAGALGGVLAVATRRPEAGAWSAEATGGSFGTWSAAADGAAGGEGWTLLGAAGADGTEGDFPWTFDSTPNVPGGEEARIRKNNAARRAAGLAKLTAQAGGARVDALLQASGGRREIAPPPDQGDPDGRDWQEDGRVLAMARISGMAPTSWLSLAARAHGRLDLLDVSTAGVLSHQRGGEAGAQLEAAATHGPGVLTATLEASGDLLQATGTGPERARAALAAALADDLALLGGRLSLVPAVRLEQTGPFGGWSASLGGRVRLADGLALRAAAGRTFRVPSFAELYLQQGLVKPNPALAPEEALGADGALVAEGRAGMASLGAYATLYRDLILYDRVSLGFLQPRNAGKALVSGLEAEAASAPIRALAGLALSASYTLLASENLRAPAPELGKWLPHRARHRLFARAAIAPGPLALHAELHYVGLQYDDAANVRAIPAALVWNAGAEVRLWRRPAVALGVEVRNLLDDRTLLDPLGDPLPGRMVLATLRAGATAAAQ